MNELIELAALIKQRNSLERDVTALIHRPATLGHIGEYIASKVFKIELALSASAKGIDGYFTEGLLQGKSVNVKWYTQAQGLLDITPNYLPDYYLVLSGPKSAAMSSRGQVQPWLIENVFVFHAQTLFDVLSQSGVKVGIATSVKQYLWEEARIFPKQCSSLIHLSEVQRYLLMLFGAASAN